MTKWLMWSACLGNLFEHYENALFGFLSLFLAPLIFPQQDPLTALILTYAMIPLGMLARPVGAFFFGYIGDTYGRKIALFWSLLGMSIVSALMALAPTFEQAGWLSPVLFVLFRFSQNFLASGESMGGAIFLLEHAPEKRHDFLSSIYNASTIAGLLLASGGVSILSYLGFIETGWRFLYLFGCFTGVFGCVIRKFLPELADVKKSASLLSNFKTIWAYKYSFLMIAWAAGFSYANYSIALVLLNGFIPMISSLSKVEMANLNSWLLILDFATLPLFGWLSSKVSRERLMLLSAISVVIGSIPAFLLLENSSYLTVVIVRIFFVLVGVAFFAPFHAWAQKLLPKEHRYVIVSLGYAIGSQLFGGPTAAISLWLFKETGSIPSVAGYLILMALGCCGFLRNRRVEAKELDASLSYF